MLEVGAGNLIPVFEDHLVGLETGGRRASTLKFPGDYHARSWR